MSTGVGPTRQVRSVQLQLQALVAATAIMLGVAAWLFVLIIGILIQMLVNVSSSVASMIPFVAVATALGMLGLVAWQGRFAWSFQRVALWIEERAPELKYALVTLIDPRYATSPVIAPLGAQVEKVRPGRFVGQVARRSVPRAAVALLVATIGYFAIPADKRINILSGSGRAGTTGPGAVVGNRLEPLEGRLTPPPYTQMRAQQLDDPTIITGVVGSRITLSGNGAPNGIEVMMDTRPVQVMKAAQSGRWMIAFTMPDSATALKLVDREYDRLIVLDARTDEPPVAKLIRPERDTTLRTAVGSLSLEVDLNDDIGLANTRFEYIVSSGESEGNFSSRSGNVGAKNLGNARSNRHALTVPYSQFDLKPGDVFTVRAVVFDANNLSGPGKGFSESRTIRIARIGEYDSLSVTPAPPSADTALISLRMLILQVEKLHARRNTMVRDDFVKEAYKLSNTSDGIRRKIQQIIDETTGNGEIKADTLLTIALDAMWDATRSLQIAETGEALPFLYTAYKALEKFRDAKKYYIRGAVKTEPVNVDKARMQGADSTFATARKPIVGITDDVRRQKLSAGYRDVVRALAVNNKKDAVEFLTLMRVEALRGYLALATVLGEATQAVQQGKDASHLLARARQYIDGTTVVSDTLPMWSGSWR